MWCPGPITILTSLVWMVGGKGETGGGGQIGRYSSDMTKEVG